jgi:hypothetical protein
MLMENKPNYVQHNLPLEKYILKQQKEWQKLRMMMIRCWQGCEETGIFIHCWRESKMA